MCLLILFFIINDGIFTSCTYSYYNILNYILIFTEFRSWKINSNEMKNTDFAVCARLLQLCPTVCNLMDYSLLSSSVHGIPQARILKWILISFSRGSSWPRERTQGENPGILRLSALAVRFFTTDTTWEDFYCQWYLSLYIMVFVYDVIIRVAEIPW